MRAKMLDQLGDQKGKKPKPAERPKKPAPKADDADQDTTSGLLAAKRRARDRYKDDGS